MRNRVIITGPDIDKLAQGLYEPEVLELTNTVKELSARDRVQRAELKKLRKQLRGALNHQETLLSQLAESREKRERLARDNNRLRAQLLNNNITPLGES
jgi:hypothetical protein